MRALFYMAGREWTGSTRAFLVAAQRLQERGHQTTLVCRAGTPIVQRIAGRGVETILLDRTDGVAGMSWELRRILRERFIEVAFVHTDAEQLAVGTAMRMAERGAVIRRVPAFTDPPADPGMLSGRLAAAGLLVSNEQALEPVQGSAWPIPPAVAPLGVDPADDDLTPIPRRALGLSDDARIVGCPYAESGHALLGNVFRAFKLLATRHPDLYLAVIGPAAADEQLRLHAAAVGISRRVLFLADNEDDRAAIAACDLVWLAAAADTGAFAALDSMVLRRCMVAERTPLSEHYVADGLTGALLPPGDADALAAAVASVLAHPERRGLMGDAAHARVLRDFSESAMVDGFERAGIAAGDRTRWAVR